MKALSSLSTFLYLYRAVRLQERPRRYTENQKYLCKVYRTTNDTYFSEECLYQEMNAFSFLNKLRFYKENVGKNLKTYKQLKGRSCSLWQHTY